MNIASNKNIQSDVEDNSNKEILDQAYSQLNDVMNALGK
jgi:hypothetical protein